MLYINNIKIVSRVRGRVFFIDKVNYRGKAVNLFCFFFSIRKWLFSSLLTLTDKEKHDDVTVYSCFNASDNRNEVISNFP